MWPILNNGNVFLEDENLERVVDMLCDEDHMAGGIEEDDE